MMFRKMNPHVSKLLRLVYWLLAARIFRNLLRSSTWQTRFRYLVALSSWGSFGFLLAHAFTRPHGRSAMRKLLGMPARPYYVKGKVNKKFLSVKEAFELNYKEGLERASQLVIYHKGKLVVDLFGNCGKTVGTQDLLLHEQYMSHPIWTRLKAFAWEMKLISPPNAKGYDATSLQHTFNATQPLGSMAIAIAVDRGYLKYEDLIIKHWPEFAGPDPKKAALTVADLLRHEAGMQTFSERLSRKDIEEQTGCHQTEEDADTDQSPAALADQPTSAASSFLRNFTPLAAVRAIRAVSAPIASPVPDKITSTRNASAVAIKIQNTRTTFFSSRRAYHGLTRGLILNELLRRVDPKRRTVPQFVREELTVPLGVEKDCHLGGNYTPDTTRLATIESFPDFYTLMQIMARLLLGTLRLAAPLEPNEMKRLNAIISMDPALNWLWRVYESESSENSILSNQTWVHKITSPCNNGLVNARALGVIGAMWLNGGEFYVTDPSDILEAPEEKMGDSQGLQGVGKRVRILSKQTVEKAESGAIPRYDVGIQVETSLTQGGFNLFQGPDWDKACHGFIGWGGYGGSVFVWHPELELVVAYTQCGLGNPLIHTIGMADERCLRIIGAVRQLVEPAQPVLSFDMGSAGYD
eukprot:gb/GEZN01003022.1/.p1 GENE.gb/GEZN01003022.1/~~gb/GEZN01003022.1/.p1  ORF type:complete len:660 (-),score=112.55 gb/GEZN01003022.1/:319-2229(-)